MADDAKRATERIEITAEQADLLLAADGEVERAQTALQDATRHANRLARFALAGAGAHGRIVGVDTDTDPPALVVEVAAGDDDDEGAS